MQIQIPSAYLLPRAHLDRDFQENPLLAFWISHVCVLLLCPIRSLFRIVGSFSRMDGGIFLSSTTALLATSCRTGVSLRKTRSYLHHFVLWWAKTVETWHYEELLYSFIHTCRDVNPAAIAAGLLQKRARVLRMSSVLTGPAA